MNSWSMDILTEFVIPLAQVVAPTLGVVLVAWLRDQSGRRVRLKCSGVEAEARTAAEVEGLLKRAAEFRDGQTRARRPPMNHFVPITPLASRSSSIRLRNAGAKRG
jgi:hypothetical protein